MNNGNTHFCGSVDLRPARPRSTTSGIEIFFLGYFSNLAALCRQAGLTGDVDLCLNDVIAKCFELWRREICAHLEGQFALVIADYETGEVLLAHDALGVVPLYWSLKDGRLRFATRVRELVDHEARNSLNLTEIRRYILGSGAASEATVYASINRLETGTSLWIRSGSVSRNTDWDPRRTAPIVYGRAEQYVEHFLELVRESVEGALCGARGAWLGLSGGLDSNTLLPPALEYCPGLKAFSIIFPQWPDTDESRWIKRIVERRGLVWQPVDAADVLPFGDIPQQFCGAPDTGVIHQRVNTVLGGLIGKDIQLTGEGGDSFMGAQMGPTPSHLADPLFSGQVTGVFDTLRQWARESRPSRPPAYWITHGLLLPALRHVLRRSVRPPHYHLHPPWLLFGRRLIRRSLPRQPKAASPHCKTPGQQAILDDLWQCAENENASAGTYTCRYPLFHRPLFEFLWAIPWSQKHLPLCDRYLQRRALKGLIDDDIRTRIGFGTGTRSFVEGLRRSKPWQDYLCDSPAMAALGLVDADGWRQAINQACVGQTGAEALLLRAISVEVWLKQLAAMRPQSSSSVPSHSQVSPGEGHA
ncbi:MAG: asparagine synthase-related protein [Pseudomonadota bacterium]|nr:asparagine synthase-related protein [Pseudomonadota bacterium]